MSTRRQEGFVPLEPSLLEHRLRSLAETRPGAGVVDDLEMRHLIGVILHGALLLHDLYRSDRIGPLYAGDPRSVARGLLTPILEREVSDRELVARVSKLPDEVRLLGDKCLFDIGISLVQQYRGIDLQDLGVRAYRMASEILVVLADDDRLKEFFDRNRLVPLPISEEITFLNQCAERFGVHADLLQHLHLGAGPEADTTPGIIVPRMKGDTAAGPAVAAPLRKGPGGASPAEHDATDTATQHAPRLSELDALHLSREELLASYERILLFSGLDVENLRARLEAAVIDQPGAVAALCDELALLAAGTHNPSRPPSYFFVGPTGVGKNHLVESLVGLLQETFETEIPLLTIDGPNYTDPSDINELRGSTRGFIRSDEEGLLAEFHQRAVSAPLSAILVDEVEKAHPHLRKFFLSLMDRGTVTDNRGRVLRFGGSILFFTSNLGYSDAAARGVPIGYRGDEARGEFERSEVDRGIRQALSAEFVNRLRIIRFRHLTRSSIERILDLELGKVARRFQEVHGLSVLLAPAAREEIIACGYSAEFGARHLAGVLDRVANVEVSKRLKRDDRVAGRGGQEVLDYLRQVRKQERAFDPHEVRERVLGAARARVPYRTLTIDFEAGEFVYRT